MAIKKTLAGAAVLLALLGVGAVTAGARADEPVFKLRLKDHRFEPNQIEVPANTKIKLVVRNDDAIAEEFDSDDLNRERVIRPGGEETIFVGPLDPGRYEFMGETHPDTAGGVLIAR